MTLLFYFIFSVFSVFLWLIFLFFLVNAYRVRIARIGFMCIPTRTGRCN